MKTRLLVPVLAVLMVAPAFAKGPGRPGPVDPALRQARREFKAAQLVSRLGLTQEQKQALKQVIEQARAARDARQNAPEVVALRGDLEKNLQRATAEVRKDGKVSEATQARLDELHKNLHLARQAHRGEGREFVQAALDILTPAQKQTLQQLAMKQGRRGRGMGPGMGAGRGMGPGMGPGMAEGQGRGMRQGKGRHGRHGRKAMFGLLLSDELYAELGR